MCVMGMREGTAACLLNKPRGKPQTVHLHLSDSGLKVVWAFADGKSDGHLSTLDVSDVTYSASTTAAATASAATATAAFSIASAAAERQYPAHTRFTIVTNADRLEFSIFDANKLLYFVCGLRHLANRPIGRDRLLWQRTAALHLDGLRDNSFDQRLTGSDKEGESLSAFLRKQRSALEGLKLAAGGIQGHIGGAHHHGHI